MNEADTFHTIETMLNILQEVALDTLRSQGNEIECAVMLCEVARVSGELHTYVVERQLAMCQRVVGLLVVEDD